MTCYICLWEGREYREEHVADTAWSRVDTAWTKKAVTQVNGTMVCLEHLNCVANVSVIAV